MPNALPNAHALQPIFLYFGIILVCMPKEMRTEEYRFGMPFRLCDLNDVCTEPWRFIVKLKKNDQ